MFAFKAMLLAMQVGGQEPGRQATKLRVKVARGDGFTALRLEGVIDEHNDLAAATAQLADAGTAAQREVLAIDLGHVKRLNSVGVRDWVNWLRRAREKFRTVVLFDCPPAVMNEVNFVKNFAEGAYIATFQVPLFCTRCDKEEARTLETVRIKNGGGLALPSFRCERADCQNALDDDEDSYLGFARALPLVDDPQALLAVTQRACSALDAVAVTSSATTLDPRDKAAPGRALGQLGLQGVPRRAGEIALAVDPGRAASPDGTTPGDAGAPVAGSDWLFIAAMAAMLGVLGVLIYLILTLE